MHLQRALGLRDAQGGFVPVILPESSYPVQKSLLVRAAKGDLLVSVCEAEAKIEERTLEPEAKDPEDDEDSEEWSDDEPEVVREKKYVPGQQLIELGVKGVEKGVEIVFNVNKDAVLRVTVRDLKSGAVVQGHL